MRRFVWLCVCAAALAFVFACSPETPDPEPLPPSPSPPPLETLELDLTGWLGSNTPEPLPDMLTPVDRPEGFDPYYNRYTAYDLPWPKTELEKDMVYNLYYLLECGGYIYASAARHQAIYIEEEDGTVWDQWHPWGVQVVRYDPEDGTLENLWARENESFWITGFYEYNGSLFWVWRDSGWPDGGGMDRYGGSAFTVIEYSLAEGRVVREDSYDVYISDILYYDGRLFLRHYYAVSDMDETLRHVLYECNLDTRELTVYLEVDAMRYLTLCEPYLLYDEPVRYGDKEFLHAHFVHMDTGEASAFTSDELSVDRRIFPDGIHTLAGKTLVDGTISFPAYTPPSGYEDSVLHTYIHTKNLKTKELLRSVKVPEVVTDLVCGDGWLAWVSGTGAFLYDGETVWLLHERQRGEFEITLERMEGYLWLRARKTQYTNGESRVSLFMDVENRTVFGEGA